MSVSIIKEIEHYAKTHPDVVSLAQGIPSFVSHPIIRESVMRALSENKVDAYSSVAGILTFREAIAYDLALRSMRYDPEGEILVTGGSMEALSATLLTLAKTGDEIIIPTPSYVAYERISGMIGAKAIVTPLQEEQGWKLNIEDVKTKISPKTKVCVICNPNNPTGSVYAKEDLLQLGKLAVKHNFTIVSDEVYEGLYFGNDSFFTLAQNEEFRNHIVRIYSFSKDYALTGWRIGYLHSDRSIVRRILPVHENLINCPPVISQYAALAGLQHQKIIKTEQHAAYKKRREIVGNTLGELKEFLSFTWPEGTYYFFPKIHGLQNSEAFCMDVLKKAKVAIVPGSGFGDGGEGHARFCFGRKEEDVIEGMKRFKEYFFKLAERVGFEPT